MDIAEEISPLQANWKDRIFPVAFFICALAATFLFNYLPDAFHIFWLNLTIGLTKMIGSLTGLVMQSRDEILFVNNFGMRIVTECTGIHYIIIITSAILLSFRHPLNYRLYGLAVTIPLLILANAIRLIVTGLSGSVSPVLFTVMHEYLWTTLFILLTCGIWIIWDRGISILNKKCLYRILLLLLLCTLTNFLFFFLKDPIGFMLSKITATILELPFVPENISVSWAGERIVSSWESSSYNISINSELFFLSTYVGLALFVLVQRGRQSILRVVTGTTGIFFLCAFLIATYAVIIKSLGVESAQLFLWTSTSVMLLVVILFGWGMMRERL